MAVRKTVFQDVVVTGKLYLSSQPLVGLTRSTVSNAGTITVGQIATGDLFQDASGGAVTMTTPTAAALDTAFPGILTGQAISFNVSSNHATNTSTMTAGSGITAVGSMAVTNTGGAFQFVKTGTGAYDLVRVA